MEKKPIKRVYIAGALSSLPSGVKDTRTSSKVVTDYIKNCSRMVADAVVLLTESDGKLVPYIPCLDFLMGFWSGSLTEENYRTMSMAFLEVCDYMLISSESKGVDAEKARAKELGIPIYDNTFNLVDAYREVK